MTADARAVVRLRSRGFQGHHFRALWRNIDTSGVSGFRVYRAALSLHMQGLTPDAIAAFALSTRQNARGPRSFYAMAAGHGRFEALECRNLVFDSLAHELRESYMRAATWAGNRLAKGPWCAIGFDAHDVPRAASWIGAFQTREDSVEFARADGLRVAVLPAREARLQLARMESE